MTRAERVSQIFRAKYDDGAGYEAEIRYLGWYGVRQMRPRDARPKLEALYLECAKLCFSRPPKREARAQ